MGEALWIISTLFYADKTSFYFLINIPYCQLAFPHHNETTVLFGILFHLGKN